MAMRSAQVYRSGSFWQARWGLQCNEVNNNKFAGSITSPVVKHDCTYIPR